MKKLKVENISSMRLDFFLKQGNVDVRIVIGPGESSWCDEGSVTRSMILYHRKRLIKVCDMESSIEIEKLDEGTNTISDTELQSIIVPEIKIVSTFEFNEEPITPLEKAQKETEDYKKESEKKYKGKKRGRKKKRGPKSGSRKNKINNLPTISESNTNEIITSGQSN